MPFFDSWEDCCKHCEDEPSFVNTVVHCLLVTKGEVEDQPTGDDSVHKDDTRYDSFTAEYDGHTLESFTLQNKGCTPTEAGRAQTKRSIIDGTATYNV